MTAKPAAWSRGVSMVQMIAAVVGLVLALGTPLLAAYERLSRVEWGLAEHQRSPGHPETVRDLGAITERLARIEEKLDAIRERLGAGGLIRNP
jgi:hypothetical protein